MTGVVVNEGIEAVVGISILLIELLGIQLSLLSVRHRMKLFDISKQRCFIESLNVFQLKEAKSGHLLMNAPHYLVFGPHHVDSR